jgi:ribokinase
VDLSLAQQQSGYRSPQAIISVDPASGERTIYWSRGDLPPLDHQALQIEWLADVDLLFLDGHEPQAGIFLARAARQRGLPVVLDAGTLREGLAELVPHCTDVISSAEFAPALTGYPDPERALTALADFGPDRVAMTFGAAGCLALRAGKIVHIPAFAVPVLDTTGAGDAFHAGYAFARGSRRSWRDCLVFGSATAALKCRNWGGRQGLPSLAEVEDLMREGELRSERPSYGFG